MKQKIVNYRLFNAVAFSCLLATVLIVMTGCFKVKEFYITDKISKDSPSLVIENILDIYQQYQGSYNGTDNENKDIKYRYKYSGNFTQESLENTYRLSFYIKLDSTDFAKVTGFEHVSESDRVANGIVLLPCDSSLDYSDYKKYPIFEFATQVRFYTETNRTIGITGAHFKIEDLEEIGYISEDRNEQKDLCLFEKTETSGWGWKHNTSSNKLRYTAQEINAIMEEYEGLR